MTLFISELITNIDNILSAPYVKRNQTLILSKNYSCIFVEKKQSPRTCICSQRTLTCQMDDGLLNSLNVKLYHHLFLNVNYLLINPMYSSGILVVFYSEMGTHGLIIWYSLVFMNTEGQQSHIPTHLEEHNRYSWSQDYVISNFFLYFFSLFLNEYLIEKSSFKHTKLKSVALSLFF